MLHLPMFDRRYTDQAQFHSLLAGLGCVSCACANRLQMLQLYYEQFLYERWRAEGYALDHDDPMNMDEKTRSGELRDTARQARDLYASFVLQEAQQAFAECMSTAPLPAPGN